MESETQTKWPAEVENYDADEPIPNPHHEQEYIKILEDIMAQRQSEIDAKRKTVSELKSNFYHLMHQYNNKCEEKRKNQPYR